MRLGGALWFFIVKFLGKAWGVFIISLDSQMTVLALLMYDFGWPSYLSKTNLFMGFWDIILTFAWIWMWGHAHTCEQYMSFFVFVLGFVLFYSKLFIILSNASTLMVWLSKTKLGSNLPWIVPRLVAHMQHLRTCTCRAEISPFVFSL